MPLLLLLLLSLTSAALGQVVSPPDGIHLVGTAANVTFRWGGTAPEYFLEVTAGRATVFSGPVKGQSFTLPLQPGPLYRWKVSPASGGTFQDSGTYHSFQFRPELTYRFDGTPGAPGPSGQVFGQSGGAGQAGRAGAQVHVELQNVGDFIQVNLSSSGTRRQLWLVPGSTPLQISASGGAGGPGGAGAPGLPGQANLNRQTGYVVSTPGGNGGNGGPGGDGGAGGSVTVRCGPGLDPRALIQVTVAGGVGGPGGAPGPGGDAPNTYFNGGLNGPPGQPGAPGQPGPNGRQGRPGVSN